MLSGLKKYILSIMRRDPAAKSALEVILCYPGFHAVVMHRVAHFFYRRGWYLTARLISQFSRFLTAIEIHPGAKIGEGLFIDHGGGVVIGETAEIGKNVTIYQGVTLGGTGKEKEKRHPTIGDNVVISTGAKVLGSFTVGENSRIGAGSVVLRAVPPNSTVVGVPGKVVARNGQKLALTDEADIDLRHDLLPDPVAEMMSNMQANIELLEERVRMLENKH
ncbi:serine O-acetyltransferase [Pelotomaculum terephthalicicum JT]|uniref:serine O-acetyltransferase n=1 Tax=Pelotomaculum TaxID=191373 RepID=UPI0009C863D0|nr:MULTISPECIES: serine O-acetyltransferase [Pelotomaculum]MCG9969632.1 serine O-acetyltransferase [Pelotomaculum terephthalicicum JT]OPX85824.1 MAG: Serine acetyltransferase [Pelotomaculum sp. PtaB.Bin117]OPY60767.1 MAG: Serine acetyltransferase [Pelotomaculum sp. PtaU1.Bin065]